MELPLTSTVPTVIEITEFIAHNWPQVWWFLNWYLGVPLRFVTGPIVPVLLIGLHTALPFLTSYILLLCISWIAGAVGLWFFLQSLGMGKRQRLCAILLWIFLPGHVYGLVFGNGLHQIALSLVPWVWAVWRRQLKSPQFHGLFLASFLVGLVLLVNISTFLAALVGLVILTLLESRTRWQQGFIELGLFLLAGFLLATIWYSLRFWWVLIQNPSLGGKPLHQVLVLLGNLVEAVVPVIVGVWAAKKGRHFHSPAAKFALLFGVSFGFLTLIRFLSDWDFVADWTGYILELELSAVILTGFLVGKAPHLRRGFFVFSILLLSIFCIAISYYLFRPNSQVRQYQDALAGLLTQAPKSARFFVTGSPVFWLGERLSGDFLQVRGGHDEDSTHKTWAMAAYQIREGTDAALLKDWTKILGVSELVVQSDSSQEPFHDFKNFDRFQSLEKGAETVGINLYQMEGVFAYAADKQILSVNPPTAGNDTETIAAYTQQLHKPLPVVYENPQTVVIGEAVSRGDVVVLTQSFDPRWHITQGQGRLTPDHFGNTVLVPETGGEFRLQYQESLIEFFVSVGLYMGSVILLSQSGRMQKYFTHRARTFQVDDRDEEIDY